MNARPAIRGAGATVELVDSCARLEALAAEWWTLWRCDPRATPFQSPAWLLPWMHHYAPDRSGAIALRRAGELVALLPYFHWRGALLLAGTGPSDYGDLLCTDAVHAAPLLDALAAAADALGCATIDLQQLRPGSPLLGAAAPHGWLDVRGDGIACPTAPLHPAGVLGSLSARRRRNLRRARRLLHDAGIEAGGLVAAELDGAADVLVRLHRLRWAGRGEDGVVDARLQRFLHEAIPALDAAGLLRFQRLRHGQAFVAATFAMRGADGVHCYLSGFDPAWERTSPGLVAIAAAMDAAAREGAGQFHFLRGREPYKYDLGAQERPIFRRRLTRPRIRADSP